MSWSEFSLLLSQLPAESALKRRLAQSGPRPRSGPAAAERFWAQLSGAG